MVHKHRFHYLDSYYNIIRVVMVARIFSLQKATAKKSFFFWCRKAYKDSEYIDGFATLPTTFHLIFKMFAINLNWQIHLTKLAFKVPKVTGRQTPSSQHCGKHLDFMYTNANHHPRQDFIDNKVYLPISS